MKRSRRFSLISFYLAVTQNIAFSHSLGRNLPAALEVNGCPLFGGVALLVFGFSCRKDPRPLRAAVSCSVSASESAFRVTRYPELPAILS
jgi:hypothetical protein